MATDENMFREVMGAISQGQRARARDLLTRLLKTNQGNVEYWLWMSSVMDTPQERIYCLETVRRLEPNNPIAKRGLILAGALPPGDTVTPAPPPRRKWSVTEAQSAQEPQQRIGFIRLPRILTTPAARPFIWGGLGLIGIIALVAVILGLGLASPRKIHRTITPLYETPSATPPGLPTETPRFRTPTATLAGPTPLWVFMHATYTATPRYIATPHAAIEAYLAGLRAFDQGDIDAMTNRMNQAVQYDPNSPDLWYYLGESQRMNGDYNDAVESYNRAISVNSLFAPAYVGRALTNSYLNPQADVIKDLELAISLDPNLLDSYYYHAAFSLEAKDLLSVQKDLKSIERLAPASLTFYGIRSMLYLAQEKPEQALQDAQSAHDADVTSLVGYYVLGNAYFALENYSQAALYYYTYQLFNPSDADTLLKYGQSLYFLGEDYPAALDALDRTITQNDKLAEAYHYRGLVYLAVDESAKAVKDINKALNLNTTSFDIRLDLGRALLADNKLNTAYDVLRAAEKYAKDDAQLAMLYYWRAKVLDTAGNSTAALADWRALLALPATAVPSAWRSEALSIVPTNTPTITNTLPPSNTPTETTTFTPTPLPSDTPTRTPIPSKTPLPTRTPVPSKTPLPTDTLQPTHTPAPTATHTPAPTVTHTPAPTATQKPVPTATQKPAGTSTPTSKP
jgi:tetratricopeptide (TPR) repeat protein